MYDMMFGELLKAYSEMVGAKLHPETAQMLYLMRRLAREHDDEFERRSVTGESLARDDVLAAEKVQECRERFSEFVSRSIDPQIIVSYLRSLFEEHYQEHLDRWEAARQDPTPESVRSVLELDSGLQLVATMDCIALFNGHKLQPAIKKQFHHLGMAGKMANDMTDLGYDVSERVPNFLHAILLQYPEEWDIAREAGKAVGSKGKKWWLKNCPASIQEFFAEIELHYSQINSIRLKCSCDLMVWPTIVGFDYKNKRRSHA